MFSKIPLKSILNLVLHLQVNTSRLKSKSFKVVLNVSLEVDLIYLSCDLCEKAQLKSCALQNNPGVAQESLKLTLTRIKSCPRTYQNPIEE